MPFEKITLLFCVISMPVVLLVISDLLFDIEKLFTERFLFRLTACEVPEVPILHVHTHTHTIDFIHHRVMRHAIPLLGLNRESYFRL